MLPISMFEKYKDKDENYISPSGFEALASDLGLNMNEVDPLLLAWHFRCANMGFITSEEWTSTTKDFEELDNTVFEKIIQNEKSSLKEKSQLKLFYRYSGEFVVGCIPTKY
ncbi:hypothetical protein BB560_004720 [Smittium megazygosporum]|uniref:Defective in cullin neddylation protein n=1 Tax=Smittium megazygosporum TaxID=133381 RepID=A0A2T9Z8K8_9FUNG|nr:hypothetical protein BB560_004720 [Smittium megazygosporum]